MDYPRIHAPLLFYRGGLRRYLCGWVCVGNAVSQTSSLVPPVCRHCTPPGSCAAQDPELYRTYVGLGKPAAARNTDSFASEMQAKVGAWCSQCRNQRPKNCTEAMKGEKRSTPTAADEEQRSSGRKAARRERFTPGSSGSDLGGESHNLRDTDRSVSPIHGGSTQSDPWRI